MLVTKGITLEETAFLAHDFANVARCLGLEETEMEMARRLIHQVSVVPEALALDDKMEHYTEIHCEHDELAHI